MSEAGLVGSVEALWRYPVKSMMGERVETVIVTERGILGDRAYALVDQSSSTAMLKQALDRTTSRSSKARVRPIHKGVNPAIEVERAAAARAL
jgi:uncharacterized protein YcbX